VKYRRFFSKISKAGTKLAGTYPKQNVLLGHTQKKAIPSHEKTGSGRFYFIDTLGGSCEYLVVEYGSIGIKS